MKAFHQLSTVQNILASYKEDQPLHRFLTQFYKRNKQMGSRDRKISSQLIYNYYRMGKALEQLPLQDRLVVAEFLCNQEKSTYLDYYKPEWVKYLSSPISEKIDKVKESYPTFSMNDVFPFSEHLSTEVNKGEFIESQFVQPDLFVRVKRSATADFEFRLRQQEVSYKKLSEITYAFKNGAKLDQIILDKGSFEVQDLSSQKVGDVFKPQRWDKWWDCCAASGGKSLMLLDEQPDIKLLVSDIRESILENLKERFIEAGIKGFQAKVLDLTQNPAVFLHDYEFDGIILDAPCSGSGTWGRTPEMIAQFSKSKISFFRDLQRKIASNVIPFLKQGKPLIYITCSVFKEENEEQTDWLCKQFGLTLESQQIIKGYKDKADSMFVARLLKV
ncbi:Fmu (Sun) domain protein [Pseudopedobacter saltans DSM 12145]|uniref:Fmu (Sun) domain protein n=1 Tax=Pseudopedobacter saltans (strain ATCC 51119 / DSM 12145 / JCM 21818 / CCUG 39354 / LMG 10337 / NBRC 100064 / NCIMB 13643) TaxID=762903 RepID=F0S9D9_PSESL|nr:RNA methyltransferase [Pseudopedobacter saltans]ADY52489.1 Fmu (Sun) domain protein [Pseudopedobacter saltans DSM 12145]